MCSWGKSKNKRATVKYLLLIGLVIPILTGCIIPVPSGSEISAQQVSSIKVGDTTRFEIEAMLGEPNVLAEPRFAVYRLSEGKYTWIKHNTNTISAKESYDLTFVYDSSGVVLREFGYETVIEKDIDVFLSLDD